jgi:hypothetical protein
MATDDGSDGDGRRGNWAMAEELGDGDGRGNWAMAMADNRGN